MRDYKNINYLLQNYLSSSNLAYKALANYLLNYQGDYQKLTIKDLEEALFISSATPTRLAQELKLNGFNELKIALQNNKENLDVALEQYDNLDLEYYVKDITSSLNSSFKLFSQKQINTIVNKIIDANKVCLYSVGGSYLSSQDFAHKLLRLNFNVFFEVDRHVQYYIAKNLKKNDVALGITYSGTTKEVLKSLDIAKENGAYTILITSNLNISKDKYSEIIYIAHNEFTDRIFSIVSRTTIISILDIIYINILNSNRKLYYEILNNNKYKDY